MSPRSGWMALCLTLAAGLAVVGCGRSVSWAPDNRTLAVDVDGRLQLFNLDTARFTPLDTGDRYAVNPVFSPDGGRVAYYGITAEDGRVIACDLWMRSTADPSESDQKIASAVVPARDESPAELASDIRSLLALSWSPDGRKLAHSRVNAANRGGIEILDLESGEITRLGRAGESQYMPAWAPSGKELAYVAAALGARMSEPETVFDLYVARPGSRTPPRRVLDARTDGDLWAYWPVVWAETGQGIVVMKHHNGGRPFELHLVSLDGSPSRLLTRLDTPQASITPDLEAVIAMGGEQGDAVVYRRAPFTGEQVLDRIPAETRKEYAPFETLPVPLYPVIAADGKTAALPLVNRHRELRLYGLESGARGSYRIPWRK